MNSTTPERSWYKKPLIKLDCFAKYLLMFRWVIPSLFFSSRITITHACIRFVSILLLHLCITSLFPIFALFLCHNRISNCLVSNKYCCKIQLVWLLMKSHAGAKHKGFFCFLFLTKVYNRIDFFCDKLLFQLVLKLSALSSHM